MRIYLECTEILPKESTEEPDFIRIDITDLDEQQRKDVLDSIRQQFSGIKYTLIIHYCYHDEGKPCETTIIEVRK